MKSTKVALYARVSTKDHGQDTENQLRQLREFCLRQNCEIVAEYIDHASGKRGDREAFQQMFAAASRREFDLLMFWSLDRLSREGSLATLQYLERLTDYGVAYRSYTEQFIDSIGPFRDAVIAILASVARQERVRLSERTIAGLQRARAKGRVGGRPRIVCDQEQVFSLHQAGCSLGNIAARLGVSKSSVARIVAGVQ
jgi:DNA invertase Pin-like site-specific DNA recombinase